MKRIIFLTTALICFSISYGQILKLQSGITCSKFLWQSGLNSALRYYPDLLVGYSEGLGIDFFQKKYYNLSGNIGLVRKGGAEDIKMTDDLGRVTKIVKYKVTLDYLTINTTIDFKYPIKEKYIPFISVGPRFDQLVAHSHDFDYGIDSDLMKTYMAGLILGAGMNYRLTRFQIGIRADYLLNFTKIADWPARTGNVGGQITDQTLMFNLTIGYILRKK